MYPARDSRGVSQRSGGRDIWSRRPDLPSLVSGPGQLLCSVANTGSLPVFAAALHAVLSNLYGNKILLQRHRHLKGNSSLREALPSSHLCF